MITRRRLTARGSLVALVSFVFIAYLYRSPSENSRASVEQPVITKEAQSYHDSFPVLAAHIQSNEDYLKAIENRPTIIQEHGLENHPPRWNHTETLLEVFPPAYKCPHEISRLGKVAICGPIEHLWTAQSPCIVYSIAPPEDLRTLEDALAGTVGPGKCDVFGYNTARIGYLYVALPSSNNAGLDMRMPAMFAQLELDKDTGRVSVGTMEEDTEENYVSPWQRLDWKEHTFIDILKLNLPSRATHRTLSSGTLLRTWTTDHDGRTGQHVGSNARRVGHIVLKVRLDELRSDGMPMHPFDEFLHMWEALEYVGMRPFAASVDDDGYLEYSFVSIHVPRPQSS